MEPAPALSSKQQKLTLRTSQKRKKGGKNVLLLPIQKDWTRIKPEDTQVFKEKLQIAFKELNIGRPKLQYRRGKDRVANKEEALKQRSEQTSKEQANLRSRLVLGLNAVTRGLEKKKLGLVLVDANTRPTTLTNHLIWLSESSCCKCIAVPDLQETLGSILNITSLVAMGITTQEGEDKFSEIKTLVEQHSTKMSVDDTGDNSRTEVEKTEQGETEDLEEEEEEMDISKEIDNEEVDYRDLYIYKKDLPTAAVQVCAPEPHKKQKTEQFIKFSKDDDDIGVKRRKFTFHKPKVACIEGNPDRESSKKSKKPKQNKGIKE